MVFLYIKRKIGAEIKSIAFIVLYLVLFQTLILRVPLQGTLILALGIGLVIIGLSFFKEGLFLGIMPLGELSGLGIPKKTGIVFFAFFSLFLGIVATLAEPSINALKQTGLSVSAWEAPLLFALLNRYSGVLLFSIAAGVGMAVLLGMLRILFNWPLRPIITFLVPPILALTAYAYFNPNLRYLSALAWDCGAITTGPVTVPLVVSLGLGLTRARESRTDNGMSGLGVVTLASLLPVAAVLLAGILFIGKVPEPGTKENFFRPALESKAASLFPSKDHYLAYAVYHQDPESVLTNQFKDDPEALYKFIAGTAEDPEFLKDLFSSETVFFSRLREEPVNKALKVMFEGRDPPGLNTALISYERLGSPLKSLFASLRAILPLTGSLILVLLFIVRKRISFLDEISLGLIFTVAGFFLFTLGMDAGLANLGSQTGKNLPITFTNVDFPDNARVFKNFDLSAVRTGYTEDGELSEFFPLLKGETIREVPFVRERYNPETGEYTHIPETGPLFGKSGRNTGIFALILFAFFLGMGATLAEPALYALGISLEEASAGTFHRGFLIRTVALGVGIGVAFGLVRIVWGIPLLWLLAPPYIMLLFLNFLSTEEFIGIAWDSAGVTTGPITVPLIIALGLGLGGQFQGVESFGILALASVYPIIVVLVSGIVFARSKERLLEEAP